jgi:hypothetical protein
MIPRLRLGLCEAPTEFIFVFLEKKFIYKIKFGKTEINNTKSHFPRQKKMTSPADIEKYNIKLDHVSIRGQNITIGKGIFLIMKIDQ